MSENMRVAESGDLDFGSCSIPQTFFLWEFEAPGVGMFKTQFVCGKLKNGTRTFFQNLKFPTYNIPSIQNELILSQTAPSHDLPASAERHLIFL